MASLLTIPNDQSDRDRLRDDLDVTLYVEAGAGTGKTTALVARIVSLVSSGRLEKMERLAAITFTEAAAAELKERVRQQLEREAKSPSRQEAERERLAAAAHEVDLAAIQTIHAFAGSLLRTYPIEAGLPPGFATWDEVQARLDFDGRYRSWLYEDVMAESPEGTARQDAIRRALLLGMSFDHLESLASAFAEQVDLLADARWPTPSLPSALEVANEAGPALLCLAKDIPLAKKGEEDRLVREIRRLEASSRALAAAHDDVEALTALRETGAIKANVGAIGDWLNGPDGQSPVRRIKDVLKRAKDSIDSTLDAHRRAALAAVLGHLREFTLAYARERRKAGVATFGDLLTWARDLLRDDPDARRRAQSQFAFIFVDEFQDTDPLQAEIVSYLSADPNVPLDDWRAATIVPGKLFVVGDPKQSIYRFRRADIAVFNQVYGRVAADQRPSLTQNFRSVPAILDWVNDHFGREMRGAPDTQAPYADLNASIQDKTLGGVYVIGGLIDGKAAAVQSKEAEAVARSARLAVDRGWLVRDGECWRPAEYRDICILLPTRTNARRLEDSLGRHGVPYRIEGGSLVLNTPEVRDLLSCLRAIDDPSDQVALVAALRSPAYACSDTELLEWVERGGALEYSAERADGAGRIAEAMASLHRGDDRGVHPRAHAGSWSVRPATPARGMSALALCCEPGAASRRGRPSRTPGARRLARRSRAGPIPRTGEPATRGRRARRPADDRSRGEGSRVPHRHHDRPWFDARREHGVCTGDPGSNERRDRGRTPRIPDRGVRGGERARKAAGSCRTGAPPLRRRDPRA